MSVIVVATITPLPGKLDEVKAVLLDAIPDVHEEPGCELYALHEDGERLVFVEKWESTEALDVHGQAPALAAVGPALAGLVAGPPEVLRLSAVPTGNPEKGSL